MENQTEVVLNVINTGKDRNEQNYREYYVDETGDNTKYFDEICQEVRSNPHWGDVAAEASPLTCGVRNKKSGR